MLGLVILALFLCVGVALADALFHEQTRIVRLWLGLCAGLMEMMWLPALLAFGMGFTRGAQLCALAAAGLAGVAAQLTHRGRPRNQSWTDLPAWLLPALVIPLTVLGGYLQYTHVLRNIDGALWVGQSTYGDLCLHLGIATSLRNAPFPPDYSLLPGTLLGYPFLSDSMVTTMLLFGADLAQAFVVTGTLMMALVATGFVHLAWRVTRSAPAVVVATLLMFVNGGLGFIYSIDRMGRDPSAFQEIMTGFYKTPTNQPDLNLRWVNVICDMMVPQRSLLAGWMAVIPAFYLLAEAMERRETRVFALLGIWAGALPMIHTHSFLALGLISAGAMARSIYGAREGERLKTLARFALYGALAVALAAPQLLTWSVPQTLKGGSMRIRFNWVNNMGDGRLIDPYVWFWIKNVGLVWLLMLPAALYDDGRGEAGSNGLRLSLGLGALCVYIVAELIQFQPNEYDNNKLFYLAYMVMMPAMGLYLCTLFHALRGIRGRALMAAAFMGVATLSGGLSIAREVVSRYCLFGVQEAHAAEYIETHTPADAVFLTGHQHNNAVAALTGRDIVCGTGSYLYFHGIDYSRQQFDEQRMLEAPADSGVLFLQYGVDYAYISSHERAAFDVDEAWFEENARVVFAEGDVVIYELTT